MKRMRSTVVLLGVVYGLCHSAASAHGAAKAQKPIAPSAKQVQATYVSRVQVISNELKPMLAKVWTTFDRMETLASDLAKRSRRVESSDEKLLDAKEQLAKLQASLHDTIKDIKVNTKRIRALSPVPRSLRKADNDLVDFSLEMEQGLESLATWADNPTPELSLQAGRQMRKASNSFYNALKIMGRVTDPAVKNKVYVED
ncbi:MAG: hypothetical protein M3347_02130 [Armatimonadota bacterium]|nr:hypothetical protein [Armatimonadota bacterium]